MSSRFYRVEFAAIPHTVKVNVEIEEGSPISGDREVEKATFEIADGKILNTVLLDRVSLRIYFL